MQKCLFDRIKAIKSQLITEVIFWHNKNGAKKIENPFKEIMYKGSNPISLKPFKIFNV